MPSEIEENALTKIKAYLDAGHDLDAIRQAGWSSWIDHLEVRGYNLRTGQLIIQPPDDVPPPTIQPPLERPPRISGATVEQAQSDVRENEIARPTPRLPARASPASHAGFGRRVGAYFIDYLFALVIGGLPGLVVFIAVYIAVLPDNYTVAEEDAALTSAGGYFSFVYFVFAFSYYWLGNAMGGTFGKRILGLRVVRAVDGGNIGVWPGLGRVIVWVIGAIPFALGWWWASWDSRGQAWHDKAVDSMVIRKASMSWSGPNEQEQALEPKLEVTRVETEAVVGASEPQPDAPHAYRGSQNTGLCIVCGKGQHEG